MSVSSREPKVAEVVRDAIEDLIIERALVEGDQLPNEREMLEQFGVARGTLREALRLLELQGVLTIKTGRGGGPIVSRPRPKDLADSFAVLLRFDGVSVEEVLAAWLELEPLLVSLAARRATPEDVERLQANTEQLAAAIATKDEFDQRNIEFHELLYAVSGNRALATLALTLEQVVTAVGVTVSYPESAQRGMVAAHQRIVDAVRAGDEHEAGAQALRHLREFHRYLAREHPEMLAQRVRAVRAGAAGSAAST
jgi:DNA-binding FadR family transcriptional regulator